MVSWEVEPDDELELAESPTDRTPTPSSFPQPVAMRQNTPIKPKNRIDNLFTVPPELTLETSNDSTSVQTILTKIFRFYGIFSVN